MNRKSDKNKSLLKKLKLATHSGVGTAKKAYGKTSAWVVANTVNKMTESRKMQQIKGSAISFFARIDYDVVIKHLWKLSIFDPRLGIAVLLIEKIKVIFEHYNRSKSEDKQRKLSEQLLLISKEFKLSEVIYIMMPFSKKIPYGKAIIRGLTFLSVFTSKRQGMPIPEVKH